MVQFNYMEMYKNYLKERDGAEVFYNENGFITYSFVPGGELYFSEFYVVPAKRNTFAAYHFWNVILSIAYQYKCTAVVGSIDENTRNWELSARLMRKAGFKERSTVGHMVFFELNLHNKTIRHR